MPRYAPVVGLLLLACGPHLWTPAPNVPIPLAPSDSRQAFVGAWEVALTLDSLQDPSAPDRGPAGTRMRSAPKPGQWTHGTLLIADSAFAQDPKDAVAHFAFPFQEWEGYYLAQRAPSDSSAASPALFGGSRLAISIDRNARIAFNLAPGVFAYQWAMVTHGSGDTLSGYWYELSQGRELAGGQARLSRRR